MKAFFRALASAFAVEAPAQAIAGVMLLALSLYTGFQIPIPSMIGALRWISYINVRVLGFSILRVLRHVYFLAHSIRFRRRYGQRIPYFGRAMLEFGPFRYGI